MKAWHSRWCGLLAFSFLWTSFEWSTVRADVLVGTFDSSAVLRYDESTGQSVLGGVVGGAGGLAGATGVAVGPDGNIYASSRNTGQVLRYNGTTGAFLNVFATMQPNPNPGGGGDVPGAPSHLEFYNGDLYVADSGGGEVERFNGQTGAFVANAVSGLVSAGGFTFSPNGDLYASSFAGPQFGAPAVVRVSGGVQTNFVLPLTSPVQTPGGLLYVNNSLLVNDLFGNQILRYDNGGNFQGVFATIPPAIPDPLPPGAMFPSNFPSEMTFSRDGNSILVAVLGIDHNNSGTVLRYDLNGNLLGTFAAGIAAASSVALTVTPLRLRGDLNLDGHVTQSDVGVMLAAMTNLAHYQASHSLSEAELRLLADIDGNNTVNNADVQLLLGYLIAGNGSITAVPEPTSAILTGIGLGALALGMCRRNAPRRARSEAS